jgi:hypothetical protein
MQGFFAAARSLILPENRETRLSAFPDTPLTVLIAQVCLHTLSSVVRENDRESII